MKAWTDYPIVALGDTPGEPAPIRECTVLDWDRDKYCHIEVEGVTEQVKRGYLYRKAGTYGEVPWVWKWRLRFLPMPNYSAPRDTSKDVRYSAFSETSEDVRALFNKGVGVLKGNKFSFSFETIEEAERAFHYIGDLGTLEIGNLAPDRELTKPDETTACPFCGGTAGHWEGCKAPVVETNGDDELQRVRQNHLNYVASLPPLCCGGHVVHEPTCAVLRGAVKTTVERRDP